MHRINIATLQFSYDNEASGPGWPGSKSCSGCATRGSRSTSCRPVRRSARITTSAARRSGGWSPPGHPTLRHPGGSERLEPWDVVFFSRGPEGAHGIRNEAEETLRVLMVSTVVLPTATAYPNSDKVGIWTGNPEADLVVRRESKVDY